MNTQFTRSIAIALALTLGAASVSTAFAATRGTNNGPTSSGPSSSGPGGPSHSSNPIVSFVALQGNCDGNIRCSDRVRKPIVRIHWNCDNSRVYWDGSVYKDCRHEDMNY